MKILIADDDGSIRQLLSALFEITGHSPIEARNGQEAVDIAVLEKPDLILMDLTMPIVNGWEAAKAIRRIHSICHIPIIAISGIADGEMKEATLKAGINDCIEKPFEFQKLMETVTPFIPVSKARIA